MDTFDAYQLFGLDVTASEQAVTARYRKLARRHHPDTRDAAAEPMDFATLAEAYDVLKRAARARSQSIDPRIMKFQRLVDGIAAPRSDGSLIDAYA